MMEIIRTLEQGSPEWFKLRLGSIGGSSIASVCAKGQGKSRKNLLYRKAGELLSGSSYDGYTNADMQRGIEQEPDARVAYEWKMDCEVTQVGLVKQDDQKHDSPDGLVGDDGKIEIKCVIPSVHIETILSDKIPAAYRKQIQWGLHICQRQWCDFVSYSPLVKDRKIWIKRVHQDEKLIQEMDQEADRFIMELKKIVSEIRK